MTVSEIINYEHFHTPDKRIIEFPAERHFLSHLYFYLVVIFPGCGFPYGAGHA